MVRIGVTSYYEYSGNQDFSLVPFDYIKAVADNGALPVIIPVTNDREVVDHYIELIDGILLTGGDDVDPELYGERNSGLSAGVCQLRDRMEMYIIEKTSELGYPLLGICRGFQILNVFFGGTLYQDLGIQHGKEVVHANVIKEKHELHHRISIKRDSYLGELFGKETDMVNSRHHQGIRELGKGLNVSAVADDGIIEAFEDTGGRIVAVQWHPENITGISEGSSSLFFDLVERAAGR